MTNLAHLLLTPPAPEAVSRLVISLGRRYVQYINNTYRRPAPCGTAPTNHRWSRPTAICCCASATRTESGARRDGGWSGALSLGSYHAKGLGRTDPLVSPHPVYTALGCSDTPRLAAYRALFRPELDADPIDDIRMALNQGQPLGDSRFLASIERATGQRREVKPRGRPRKPVAESTENSRQLALKIWKI